MKKFIYLFTFLLVFHCIAGNEFCYAQWVQTNGPTGGSTYSFLAVGSTYFAGTFDGLFRSTDSGQNWYQVQSLIMNNQPIYCLAQCGTLLFAGGGVAFYMSSDNGLNWNLIPDITTTVYSVTSMGTYIFAGTWGNGVVYSNDNGVTWGQTALTSMNVTSLVTMGSNIYAGVFGDSLGVYLSTNNGTSWTKCYYAEGWSVISLSKNGTSLFAVTGATYYMNRIMRSTNSGQNWTMLLDNMNIYTTATNGNDIYAGTSVGVYRSSNNGTNWASTTFGSYYVRSVGVLGSNIFAGAANYGIFRSTNNGTNWVQTNTTDETVFALAINGSKIYAGTNSSEINIYGNGVVTSTNNGTTWIQTSFNSHTVYSIAISGTNVLIGSDNGIYRTTNDGINWVQVYANNQMVMAIAASGANVYSGAGLGGIYKSTNNGTTWSQTSLIVGLVQAIAINASNIFAGTQNDGLFMSTNSGLNWTLTNGPNATTSLAVNGNIVIAGCPNGIYRSTDNGQNWSLTTSDYLNVLSLSLSGSNFFAGTTDSGFYLSKNNGLSWTRKSEGMGRQTINALVVSTDYIYAGTLTSSVWKRSLAETIGIRNISTVIPPAYSLYQNYPNPFNPKTNIRYCITKNSFVKLVILDVLGREVENPVNENQSAGIYEATWDASKYSSGIYFYRLITEGFSETKRMIVIK